MGVSSDQSTTQPNSPIEHGVSDTSLESLYSVNKHAKRYAEQSIEHHRNGKKTTAKVNSTKRDALYSVKTRVISQIKQYTDYVTIHIINDNEYYYVEFRDWGFHTPVDGIVDIPRERVEGREPLPDFSKSSVNRRSSLSLKESLLHINDEFGVNANDLLPVRYLRHGSKRFFTGWVYLCN